MTIVLWLFLWFGLVEAQESPEIRIPVGEDVVARTFPRIHSSLVEVRLKHCSANLSEMLDNVRREHIRSISALNMGEQSWLLRVTLTDEGYHVDATVVDGYLELWVRKENKVRNEIKRKDLITTKELFSELVDTGIIYEPKIKLRSLYGEALVKQMKATDMQSDFGMPSGLHGAIDWSDIDEARKNYLEAKETGQSAIRDSGDAAYALGWAYLSKGFAKEAQYYFNKLTATPGNVKPVSLFLSQARAYALTDDWEKARSLLEKAYNYGADEATIVEGIAYVSHATGIPNRAKTGRLLASLTSRPESLLLAGELLQMDGYYDESIEVLEPLHSNKMFEDNENLRKKLLLRLGDASLNQGDLDGARLYWIHTYDDIRKIRVLQANMLEKGSNEWVKTVPTLRLISMQNEGIIRAEALYLIGQVYSEYGTQMDGIELWSDFIRSFPELSQKTDVIDLLWGQYRERILALNRSQYWLRIAETHQLGWVPEMRGRIDDPDILPIVAKAYEELGLSERALHVLSSDFGVGAHKSFYAPEAEMYLARLYFKSNKYYEALRTLEKIQENDFPHSLFHAIKFQEAKVYLAMQDLERSKLSYEQSAVKEEFRERSYLALGLIAKEQGDCSAAVSYLQPILLPLVNSVDRDPLAYLYLSQCLAEQENELLATEVAAILEELAPSEDELLHARYLQANFGDPSSVELDDADSTWNELIQDLKEGQEFDNEYEQWLDENYQKWSNSN
jgi:tetratricopeptide (TPR) repeat protein